MPRRAPTFCKASGCPRLCEVGETYCVEHKRKRTARYEAGRGTAAQRGYGSTWNKYRKKFLENNPFCAGCGGKATQVDHIRRVAGPEDPLFWDPVNHQSMCDGCHSSKTAKYDGGFGNRARP